MIDACKLIFRRGPIDEINKILSSESNSEELKMKIGYEEVLKNYEQISQRQTQPPNEKAQAEKPNIKSSINNNKNCSDNHNDMKWKSYSGNLLECRKCHNYVDCGWECPNCSYKICDKYCFVNDKRCCPNPKNHKKLIWNSYIENSNCSKCHSNTNSGGWKCSNCMFKICDRCKLTDFGSHDCPNTHDTTAKSGIKDKDCSVCHNNFKSAGKVCLKCQYQICSLCIDKSCKNLFRIKIQY